MALINNLKEKFLTGHERSVRAKKNILALFAVRGYSIAISLALIPITLHLLDEYKYGVWITLFNVLSWISIFDIGIGNGLRNKFAEAMAKEDIKEARQYVSTGYVVMAGISLLLILVFLIPWYFVDWSRVFNVKPDLASEISWLVGIAFVLTSIQFSLKLLGTLLTASHKPAIAAFIMALSNTLILVAFLGAKKWLAGSLIGIGFVYTLAPILVFTVASIIMFSSRFYRVRPSISYYRKDKVKSLFNLGIQFFVIQIAVLVIFQTDTMIITHTLSPEEVTSYNIVFRYFGVVTMLAGIIMTPLWSAFTEAAAKKDFIWIKQVVKNLLHGLFFVIFLIIILLLLAKTIIPIWLSYQLYLSNVLLVGMAAYTFIAVYNNIFSFLLNGLSLTKVQMITSIVGTIINIPLSIYFANKFGNGGVILATIVSLSFFAIFGTIQTYHVLKKENKWIL